MIIRYFITHNSVCVHWASLLKWRDNFFSCCSNAVVITMFVSCSVFSGFKHLFVTLNFRTQKYLMFNESTLSPYNDLFPPKTLRNNIFRLCKHEFSCLSSQSRMNGTIRRTQPENSRTRSFPKMLTLCFPLLSHSTQEIRRAEIFRFSSRVSVLSATRRDRFSLFFLTACLLVWKVEENLLPRWPRPRLQSKSLKGDKSCRVKKFARRKLLYWDEVENLQWKCGQTGELGIQKWRHSSRLWTRKICSNGRSRVFFYCFMNENHVNIT